MKRETSEIRSTLELCKLALEHASFALDGVVSLDDEDEGQDGGSATCQHAKKTVDRALKKVDATLKSLEAREPSPDGERQEGGE
jgi:hypothetical protein